jgi:GntR family transcriptional regulator, rspAB operon transcriptional repressor
MARHALPLARPASGVSIDRRMSVAVQVFDLIRREILDTTLPPGSPLSEHALSQRFGVSRTPIREALLRLAEEGLVQIVPQVGTFVTRISLAKVYEAQFIREALECAAVRAAARSRRLDVSLLHAIMISQKTAATTGEAEDFYAADEALHAAIAAASGHPRVWTVALNEKLQLDRVRMLDVSQRPDLSELVVQHSAIVAALEAKDVGAAEAAMRAHLHDVFMRLAPLIERFRAYFDDLDAPAPEYEE